MVIVITGPTAVGKTKLSVELAKCLNGEIVNADSTQVFKGLDIATAKVTKKEMNGVCHHLIDIREKDENYTVYDYQKDARCCIDSLLSQNKTPILVGGTGLYIKAALYDYKFSDEEVHETYENVETDKLYNMLKAVDVNTDIHPNNRKRIIRSLNYYNENKEALSKKEKTDKLLYDTIFIGLTTDRENLYNRINKRVDEMVNNGLLMEAKNLFDEGIRSKAVMTPIGYKELFPYFENNELLENCIDKIKQKSRNYAKRQYTWFNNQMDIKWFNVDFDNFDRTINDVLDYIKRS